MKIMIVGVDRIEYEEFSDRKGKHFYRTRGQTYKAYPDGPVRLYWKWDNPHFWEATEGTDALIIYKENSRIPQIQNPGVKYDQESVLRDIDEHKMGKKPSLWYRPYAEAGKNVWKAVAAYGGILLAGVIVLWALL